MTNEIDSGKRKISGIDYERYEIDIDAALQRRKDAGLPVQAKEDIRPIEEQLLAERVVQLAVNMKAPLAPYVAAMVGVGEKLINPKGQRWQLQSWMIFTQDDIRRFNRSYYGDFIEFLLWDTSREIQPGRINKIATLAANIDSFEEFEVDKSCDYFNLYMGINMNWLSSKGNHEIGIYSCHRLEKGINNEVLPPYVVVRPPFGYEIIKVPKSQDTEYWSQHATDYLFPKTTDAVLSAYFSALKGPSKWTLLRPRNRCFYGDPEYDVVTSEREFVSTRNNKYETRTKIEQPNRLNSNLSFEDQLISQEQRRALADRVDQLLSEHRG